MFDFIAEHLLTDTSVFFNWKIWVYFSASFNWWKFFKETSAKEILSFSSGKSNLHSMTSSKKHVLKVATQPASASASDLTELQQRSRHRSVDNLQRRSSSGSTNGPSRHGTEGRSGSGGGSGNVGGGVSNSKRVGSGKSVTKKKDGNRVSNGKSLASKLWRLCSLLNLSSLIWLASKLNL